MRQQMKRRVQMGAVVLALVSGIALPEAHATESAAGGQVEGDGDGRGSDVKLPVGVGLAIGGALSLGGGIATYMHGTNHEQRCPFLGGQCLTVADVDLQTGGVLMMTAGIGSGLFGASMIHAGSAAVPYPADNPGMMGAGVALTGLGAAGVAGASVAWMYAAFEDADALPLAGTALGISGVLLTVGVPVWFGGSKPPAEHARYADVHVPEDGWVRRNPAMATAGVGMLVAGTGIIAGGVGTGVKLIDGEGDFDNEGGLITMGTMTLSGGALLTMGIVMTVKGSTKVPPHEAYGQRDDELQFAAPEVRIGPTSGELRWRF
jgi:hypothetical protein